MKRLAPLILLTGPSGAGKSRMVTRLLRFRSLHLRHFPTTTTRSPRPGERNGHEYFFVDEATFLRKKSKGDFVEYAQVYGAWYGCDKKQLASFRSQKPNQPLLFATNPQGAKTMKRLFPETLVIFLDVPISVLRVRLQHRHAQEKEIALRLHAWPEEYRLRSVADLVIQNPHGAFLETGRYLARWIQGSLQR